MKLTIKADPMLLFGDNPYAKWVKMTILGGETAVHFCNRFEILVASVVNRDFLKLPKVDVL